MARFTIHLTPPVSPAVAFDRVLDLRAHSEVIPLTTLSGEHLRAAELEVGSRFTARTAVGPVGFDDVMVVDAVTHPDRSSDGRGSARLHKEGRLVHGTIDLEVTPRPGGSIVLWRQEIRVTGVPALLDPVVALVARGAYGTTLKRLLRRG